MKKGNSKRNLVKKISLENVLDKNSSDIAVKASKKEIVFDDITQLKNAEEKLKTKEKQQVVIANLGNFALSGVTISQLMKKTTLDLSKILNVKYTAVLKLSENREHFNIIEGHGWKSGTIGKKVPIGINSHAGYTIISKKAVVTKNLQTESRFKKSPILVSHKVVSGVNVLIKVKRKPYGVLTIHDTKKRIFKNDDIHFLVSVANLLATAIERKRTEDFSNFQAKVLSQVDDAVIATDGNLKINYINSAAKKMFGLSQDWALGKDWQKIIRYRWLKAEDEQNFKNLLLKTGSWNGENMMTTLKGNIYTNSTVSQLTNSKGKVVGILAVVRDITERKIEEERRDFFLGITGHELKTPISTIKAFAQILQKSYQKSKDKKALVYLAKIDNQANRLTKLINDLLDLTKIRAGKLDMHYEVFDFDELTKETVENMSQTAPNYNIVLKGKVGKPMVGDRNRIAQVIQNLITNAIKYSPGKNKVIVKVESRKSNVLVAIQDFGIGIKKDKVNKIFEPFYQESGQENEVLPGLGLGLFISTFIIKLHGGKIWVKSAKNLGTTFFFKLPLKRRTLKVRQTSVFSDNPNNENLLS